MWNPNEMLWNAIVRTGAVVAATIGCDATGVAATGVTNRRRGRLFVVTTTCDDDAAIVPTLSLAGGGGAVPLVLFVDVSNCSFSFNGVMAGAAAVGAGFNGDALTAFFFFSSSFSSYRPYMESNT